MTGPDGLVFLVIVGLKFTTKTYDIKDVYRVIGGPARHTLETREVLDDIKTRFFELDELTVGFTEQKDRYLILWVQNLKKMTGQIRKTAAMDALKKLQEEGLILTREAIEEYKIGIEIGKRQGEKVETY